MPRKPPPRNAGRQKTTRPVRIAREYARQRHAVRYAHKELPEIPRGEGVLMVHAGRLTFATMIVELARRAEAHTVAVASWAIADSSARLLLEMKAPRLLLLLDEVVTRRSETSSARKALARLVDSRAEVYLAKSHAKMGAVIGPKLAYLVRGSGNLTVNAGFECYDIDEGLPLAEELLRFIETCGRRYGR